MLDCVGQLDRDLMIFFGGLRSFFGCKIKISMKGGKIGEYVKDAVKDVGGVLG